MSPEAVEALVREYGYGIILVGTYFDHYGIPLFLVFGSLAAAKGILNGTGVFLCGFAGGWIADLFLYFLGYKTGLQYWMQFAFVQKLAKPIEWTGRLFKTRPALLVILGRFLFAVSKIIPPFAGMIRYDTRKYVLYSFLGNIIFSFTYTLLSYRLGILVIDSLDPIKFTNLAITGLFILAMIALTRALFRKPR